MQPTNGAIRPEEGRGWCGEMEETMRVLTIIELMRMAKIELCDLSARITNILPEFPEGSPEDVAARINLRRIRRMLARRDFSS
jgi:hypothetical protein